MHKIHLTIHVFPREIDDYDYTVTQLKVASKFINNLQIDANVILNLNDKIVDWTKATIPKQYFIDKFKNINKKLDWVNILQEEIALGEEYSGYLEKRISNTHLEGYDLFWWQDVDLVLDDLLFFHLENTLNSVDEEDFIISPQIYKYWDGSWDVICSNPDVSIDVDTFDSFEIKINQYNRNDLTVLKNKNIKFAGGWFTMLSSKLVKKIPFPINARGYGREDTLVLEWAKKNNITQYLMIGSIVQENRRYSLNNVYVDYVPYNTGFLKKVNDETAQLFNIAFKKL